MVKLGKWGVACALCLTMSLALFTSGAFAQSAHQTTASNHTQLTVTNAQQGTTSALQANHPWHANGLGNDCGDSCGDGCFNGCGNGFDCFNSCGFGHDRFIHAVRVTRVVRIVRITKFTRYEQFRRGGFDDGCDGWVGGGGW